MTKGNKIIQIIKCSNNRSRKNTGLTQADQFNIMKKVNTFSGSFWITLYTLGSAGMLLSKWQTWQCQGEGFTQAANKLVKATAVHCLIILDDNLVCLLVISSQHRMVLAFEVSG